MKLLLICAVVMSLMLLVSCQEVIYEAYVTVVNIGNMPMTAWVDGDGAEVPAYDSVTWAITLDSKDQVLQLLLEAEPSGGGKSDQITVNLHGDRDIVTWLTGWDQIGIGNRIKKESSVIKGPAPSSATRTKQSEVRH